MRLNGPVLFFRKQHFLCAPIGSKHSQENVGVGPCLPCVPRDNCGWINNLQHTVDSTDTEETDYGFLHNS